jgi:hypothetical protein
VCHPDKVRGAEEKVQKEAEAQFKDLSEVLINDFNININGGVSHGAGI